jgi:hypothetical protein
VCQLTYQAQSSSASSRIGLAYSKKEERKPKRKQIQNNYHFVDRKIRRKLLDSDSGCFVTVSSWNPISTYLEVATLSLRAQICSEVFLGYFFAPAKK